MRKVASCAVALFLMIGLLLFPSVSSFGAIDSIEVVPTPNTAGARQNFLSSVTCISPTFCMGVGYYEDSNYYWQNAAMKWNGTSWTELAIASTASPGDNYLTDVSCSSDGDCRAVGHFFNGIAYSTQLYRWNGAAWAYDASLNTDPTMRNELYGVSCVPSGACVAVGRYDNGGVEATLTMTTTGTFWTIINSPNSSSTQDNSLTAVSCVAADWCMAVGGYENNSGFYQNLAMLWDSSGWSIVPTPNEGSGNNSLSGISCTSQTNCIAVGQYNNGTSVQPLTMRFNGSTWSILPTPTSSSSDTNYMVDVSCSSSTYCIGVGSAASNPGFAPLVQSFNGSTWTVVTAPSAIAGANNFLSSVSCPTADFCMAAGRVLNGNTYQTMALKMGSSATPDDTTTTVPTDNPPRNRTIPQIAG